MSKILNSNFVCTFKNFQDFFLFSRTFPSLEIYFFTFKVCRFSRVRGNPGQLAANCLRVSWQRVTGLSLLYQDPELGPVVQGEHNVASRSMLIETMH